MADDLILDLTNYKDTVGSYVSPGRYPVVVEDAEMGESSQKKTPQLTVWLRVVGGEYDGSTLVEALYLTDSSKFRVVGFLQALNIPTPRKKFTLKLQQFIGRRLYVVVDDDTYNGRTRTRVTAFERFVAPAGAAAEPDPLEALEDADEPAAEVEAVEEVEAPAPAAAAEEAPAAKAPAKQLDEDAEEIDLDDLDL